MRILILLAYYERPKMVLNAIRSIRESDQYHKDWVLACCDDNSPTPLKPIIQSELSEFSDKILHLRSNATSEEKLESGSPIGGLLNTAIREIRADVAIVLCDDDALYPFYLQGLSSWYETHSDVMHGYSKIIPFNPLTEVPNLNMIERANNYPANQSHGQCIPSCRFDASQVSWRTKCNLELGVWFPDYAYRNQDALYFEKLSDATGPSHEIPLYAEYKGVHQLQLSNCRVEESWSRPTLDIS